jgi:hypothetical protein
VRLGIYRAMQEMRQLEKRAYDLFMRQLVKGTSHLSLGMEAVAAGFGAALDPADYTFATYRGHAHTLARGVPMTPVLAELLGRSNGLLGGKGGSMHLTSVEHGMMGSYAIIGAHLAIANGAARSARYRGTRQVAVCFFGDVLRAAAPRPLPPAVQRPAVVPDRDGDPAVTVRLVCHLCLAYDAGTVGAAGAAAFLQAVRDRLTGAGTTQ